MRFFAYVLGLLLCIIQVNCAQRAYITGDQTNGDDLLLYEVDLDTGEIITFYNLASDKDALDNILSLSADGSFTYVGVSNEDLELSTTFVISNQQKQIIAELQSNTLEIGSSSFGSFEQRQGQLYTATEGYANNPTGVAIINKASNTFSGFINFNNDSLFPYFNVLSKDGNTLYVGVKDDGDGSYSLLSVNLNNQTFAQLNLSRLPISGVLSKDGSKLYVVGLDEGAPVNSLLLEIDLSSGQVARSASLPLGGDPNIIENSVSVTLSSDGSTLFLPDPKIPFENSGIFSFKTSDLSRSSFAFGIPALDFNIPEGSEIAYFLTLEQDTFTTKVFGFNTKTLGLVGPFVSIPNLEPTYLKVPSGSSSIGIFNNATKYLPLKFPKGLQKVL